MNSNQSKLKKSIDDYLSSRRTLFIGNIMLTVAVLVLVISNLSRTVETIAVPPNLTEEARVDGNKANQAYNLTWAHHIAGLTGNVSEANSEFVLTHLELMMSPHLWSQAKDALNQDIMILKSRDAEQQFVIENAVYDEKSEVSWVWGTKKLKIPGAEPRLSRWTYEIRIKPYGGYPRITYLNAYEGPPQRRKRDDLQTVDPFLTADMQEAIDSIDTDKAVENRERSNVAPAVEIDLTEDADSDESQ
jgi:hypothetical protein